MFYFTSRSVTLPNSIHLAEELTTVVMDLHTLLIKDIPPQDIRGMGLQVSKLTPINASDQAQSHSVTKKMNHGSRSIEAYISKDSNNITNAANNVTVSSRICHPFNNISSSSSSAGATIESSKHDNFEDILIPSQLDASVLMELPPDITEKIRSKISRESTSSSSTRYTFVYLHELLFMFTEFH
jgi:hypothetical protein